MADNKMISGITKDMPSVGFLSFAIFNTCAFFMIVGFFTGTGAMHGSIEPCKEKVELELSKGFETASHHRHALRGIRDCLQETDAFVISNSGGHYFQMLLPVLLIALANMFIFATLFYIRAVRNYRFLDPLRQQKQANSLPMQQDANGHPEESVTTAKTIGNGTPPEADAAPGGASEQVV